jgi:hypothetical protein
VTQISNKEFNFENKVFEAPGAYFSRTIGTKEPLLYVQLGENLVSLQIESIRNNFGIEKGSSDDQLLNVVVESLHFVKRIRPGDSIPTEVLDGTASWSIDDHHRDLVEMRLTVALARWLSGDAATTIDMKMLMKMAEDPEVKKRAQDGVDKLAEETGIGKENRQQVLDKIEALKDELSYIEALKEHFNGIRNIVLKLQAVRKLFHDDKTLGEEIDRIKYLMAEPVKGYTKLFREIETETGDIFSLIQSFTNKVDLIRRTRDDLRAALLDWEEMMQMWNEQIVDHDMGVESSVRKTYRFVATNFPLTQSWKTG